LNYWVSVTPTNGRSNVRLAFAVSPEFAQNVAALCPGTSTSANLKYVLTDLQGSARALMDNSGSIVARHDYLPFGEEIFAGVGLRTSAQKYSVTDKVRQRFAMTERDEATGLDHTLFRNYDSFAGRWTSPDPYGGSMNSANPQSFNRYAYVGNDPVNLMDPSGLDGVDDLGPPPPPPTLVPPAGPLDRIITDIWAPLFPGGILGSGGNSIPEEPPSDGVPDTATGEDLQGPQKKGPCAFNVNISGVSGQNLTDMENEISRIFASGGFDVVFNQPELANGGSVNLAVTGQFFGLIAQDIGSDLNNRGRLARTLDSNSQVNSTNIFNAVNRGRRIQLLRPTKYASYGTMFGRIGAHEVITHALLGTSAHPFNLQPDIRNVSLAATLAARDNLQWNIGEDTANALRAKCP
jgi:RHS repeat-associated protein